MAGSRRRTLLIVAVLVVVSAAGGIVYRMMPDDYVRGFCQGGGLFGPVESTPERAFAAWWEVAGDRTRQPEAPFGAGQVEVDPPVRDDFGRVSDNEWEWRYGREGSVVVEVNRTETGTGWQVAGISTCAYQPSDKVPD
jgi:hypothetical protein